jgi:SPP1 gp7 family putative phage head morphogenesis protein
MSASVASFPGSRIIPIAERFPVQTARFQTNLSDIVAQYLAAANIVGRLHVMQAAKNKIGSNVAFSTMGIPSRPTQFADVQNGALGFESVPFTQAIDRIRNLTPMTRLAFDALASQYKLQAFTVSGVSDVKLIDNIQQALLDIMQSGGTQSDFAKAVAALTSDAGVNSLLDTQINTIFQTNVQTAYSNGRFAQMRDSAVTTALPIWQYHTVEDSHVRPAHAALDGFAAQYDDPVWRRIYPPCGYNCRCSVSAMSPGDAPGDAQLPGLPRIPAGAASVPDPGFGGAAFS